MDSFDKNPDEMTEEELAARYVGTETLKRIIAAEVGQPLADFEEYEEEELDPEVVNKMAAQGNLRMKNFDEYKDAPKGAFESLMELIENEIAKAEGGYYIDNGKLVIVQRESRDVTRRNNGGEYDYWLVFQPDGFGVEVWESWSCDIANRSQYGGLEDRYDCIVSLDGLERMAKLAQVTTAAKAWLKKEPGCMKKLKEAIRALDD